MGRRSTADEIRTEMVDVDPIIRQLRAARLAAGYTQAEIAERAGVASRTHFSFLERGHHDPGLGKLRRWAAELGFDVVLVPREATDA